VKLCLNPDHRRPVAGVRQQLAEMETELRRPSALDQLREDRSGRSSELAKLHSDLEYLRQAAWPRSTSRQVLREDAQIARLLDEELVAEEETAACLKQRNRADGPVNMMALDE